MLILPDVDLMLFYYFFLLFVKRLQLKFVFFAGNRAD